MNSPRILVRALFALRGISRKLGVFVLVTLSVLALSAGTVLAADVAFEAETMSEFSSAITVVSDSDASAGKALKYASSPAKASKRLTLSEAASTIVVRARGTTGSTNSYPELSVYLDGQRVLATRSLSTTYAEYKASADVQPGTHTIEVGGAYLRKSRVMHVDLVRLPTATPEADTIPPETTIDSGPSGTTSSADAQFTFSSSEANSTFECSIDGGAWQPCSSPQAYQGLAATQHTFKVRATDAAGNTDQSPAARTWTIEASSAPPEDCSKSLQQLIQEAAPGSVASVPACTYREAVTVDKPLTLVGGGNATIKGSEVWKSFSTSGGNWISSASVPTLPLPTSFHCESGTSRCQWPEQVFIDGLPQTQVSSSTDPGVGEFKVDSGRHVVLGGDPGGKTVEVTVRPKWMTVAANGVTLTGFNMMHAGNEPQTGALQDDGFDDFTLENSTLSDAHGAVASLRDGLRMKVLNSHILRGGQLGIHNSKGTLEVRDTEIAYNNTELYSASWEAGGMKNSGILRGGTTHRVVADNNHIHHNQGKGIWSDVSAQNITYTNNRVHNNDRNGIQLEITDGGTVTGNVVYENGFDKAGWGWGASILISSSRNVEVANNLVAWGPDGISVISACRSCVNSLQEEYDRVMNVRVHDNKILSTDRMDGSQSFGLAWLTDFSDTVLFDPASNNSGSDNAYYYPTAEGWARFAWDGTKSSLGAFNATPGEERGRYIGATEKDTLVSRYALPPSPER